MFSFLKNFCQKNSFLFSVQQETFFYFNFFNLLFPANMDLQGLPLTAWGWEEASPQAKSFWSVSFIGILASSSQEKRSHCQRHNTRPKWPFNLTKHDSSYVHRYRAHGGGCSDFSMGKQQVLLLLWWAQSRGRAGTDFCVVGERVIRSLNSLSTLLTWLNQSGCCSVLNQMGPVTNRSIVRILEMQQGQSTFLLQSCTFVQIHICIRIRTHTKQTSKYKARL